MLDICTSMMGKCILFIIYTVFQNTKSSWKKSLAAINCDYSRTSYELRLVLVYSHTKNSIVDIKPINRGSHKDNHSIITALNMPLSHATAN